MSVKLIVIVYWKDMFTSFSSHRKSRNRSISADVNASRYKYENGNVESIVCIPGEVKLTDPGKKADSSLTQALILSMVLGILSIYI